MSVLTVVFFSPSHNRGLYWHEGSCLIWEIVMGMRPFVLTSDMDRCHGNVMGMHPFVLTSDMGRCHGNVIGMHPFVLGVSLENSRSVRV